MLLQSSEFVFWLEVECGELLWSESVFAERTGRLLFEPIRDAVRVIDVTAHRS